MFSLDVSITISEESISVDVAQVRFVQYTERLGLLQEIQNYQPIV